MREPSQVAREAMDRSTDDVSHVFVQDTGELWVMSVWHDPVEWTDAQDRGWHWKPDPRPAKKEAPMVKQQSPRERAARALCRKDGNPENITFEGKPMWQSYLDTVDIVLDAIGWTKKEEKE